MHRLVLFFLALALSLSFLSAPASADPAPPPPAPFSWAPAGVAPTISLENAEEVAIAYLGGKALADEKVFVQITDRQRRGNVTKIVFYGWRLHYPDQVSKNAPGGRPGTTLLINGSPAVQDGTDGGVLWPSASVVADIPDTAP